MTRPRNRVYRFALSTAVTNLNTAPSFMLLGRGKNPATVKWSQKDRVLFSAVLSLEALTCPDCGVPIWHGHTTDDRVEFELQWSVCYSCQAKEDLMKGIEPKAGERATVQVVLAEGYEDDSLPTMTEGMSTLGVPIYDVRSEVSAKPAGVGSIGD